MKSIRLIVGVTVVGFGLAVGCGDDTKTNTNPSTDGGDGNATGGTTPKAGNGNVAGTKNNGDGGMSTANGGSPGTDGGVGQSMGGEPNVPGCGNGPACDADSEECIDGSCFTVDGEACTLNTQCVHTCINGLCAPRADVLEDCDYEGAGGAGAGGAGAGGAAGSGGDGAGGEGIYVPPEEIGNGDDKDCLDGLACDSGACKRKQQTDCTGPEQCLSGLCHKSKCTLQEAGVCSANECGAADADGNCGSTTTATNQCSFNYLPNSDCVPFVIKVTSCFPSCECQLAP